ncbi:MAG: cellulase family glycosylhydrolase [Candidatus Kerfeldbacteria bacterium]|nr:cellulase family glycosylhydrolase [Candidatus Kerfeldbacteria bacterium]
MKKFLLSVILFFPFTLHAQTISADTFGANIHLMQRVPQSEWESVLATAKAHGIMSAREEFSWNTIEPSDDDFEWSIPDAAIDAYTEAGIVVDGLLTYSSVWAASSEHDVPDLNAWQEYVSAVATRYAGKVEAWEIWNEPNHQNFFTGDSVDYVYMVQAARDAIREADPSAKIILGGLAGADTSFLREVLPHLNSESIDAIAIHPYRVIGDTFTYQPEEIQDGLNTLAVDIQNLVAELELHDFEEMPIWFTEFGYPTHDDGLTQKEQAQYLARAYVIALSSAHVQKIFWYSMIDAGTDASDQENNFGLFNADYIPKTAAALHLFLTERLVDTKVKGIDLTQTTELAAPEHLSWNVNGAVCTSANVTIATHVKLSYAFTGDDNCYVPLQASLALPSNTQTLFMELRGSSDDTILRVRVVDSTGETFQYSLARMPHETEWYRVDFGSISTHWGGDDDGVVDQPLKLDSLVLDDNDGAHESGTMVLKTLRSSTSPATYIYRLSKNGKPRVAFWTTATKYDGSYTFTQLRNIARRRFEKARRMFENVTTVSSRVTHMPGFLQVR